MSGTLSKLVSTPSSKADTARAFSILVCGRTGIGKSTLINCILGEDVCKVGDPGESDDEDDDDYRPFDPRTMKVTGYIVSLEGVRVTIFDSPGLQDGKADEASYLADMKAKCSKVDLVFYCLEMTQARYTENETNSVRLLTETFGASFWNKAVVVLTKANMLQSPKKRSREEMTEYFNKWTDRHEKRFREVLFEVLRVLKLSPEDCIRYASTIPAVPAGSEDVQILPNERHFIAHIWCICTERVPPEVRAIFVQATNVSDRFIHERDIEAKCGIGFQQLMRSPPSEFLKTVALIWRRNSEKKTSAPADQGTATQASPDTATKTPPPPPRRESPVRSGKTAREPPKYPIIANKEDVQRLKNALDTTSVIATTSVGGVAGAAIGGLIGTLGLPGPGTLTGAAVGGAVGAAVGWLWRTIN